MYTFPIQRCRIDTVLFNFTILVVEAFLSSLSKTHLKQIRYSHFKIIVILTQAKTQTMKN